jgi:hypothetical protein
VRDGAGWTATDAARAKLAVRRVGERLKRGKLVKNVVGEVMKADPALEHGVGDGRHPHPEHRGEIRKHRAEHELRLVREAAGHRRVTEEVHSLSAKD